jgi:hypothetical protein
LNEEGDVLVNYRRGSGRLYAKIVAKNATRNKYLNSIHYNLPGNFFICGGNSQYVLIYDI